MRIFATVAAVLALGASADAQTAKVASRELGPPEIKKDQYSPTIDVVSSSLAQQQINQTDFEAYTLVGKINKKSGEASFAVQWVRIYKATGWRHYQRASDASGTPLTFKEVSRSATACARGSCLYDETYNIYFSKEQVASGMLEGLDFKIYARDSSSAVVRIPADQMKQFGEKMIEAERSLATKDGGGKP